MRLSHLKLAVLGRFRTGSGLAPSGFRVGSGWFRGPPGRLRADVGSAPGGFWVGSGWVLGRLRVYSGLTPGGFWFGSGCVPGRLRVYFGLAPGGFWVGSERIPDRLRMSSGSALVGSGGLRVDSGRMPVDFRVGFGWVPGRLQKGSGSAPGGFQVGSWWFQVGSGSASIGSESASGGFRVGSGWVLGRPRLNSGSDIFQTRIGKFLLKLTFIFYLVLLVAQLYFFFLAASTANLIDHAPLFLQMCYTEFSITILLSKNHMVEQVMEVIDLWEICSASEETKQKITRESRRINMFVWTGYLLGPDCPKYRFICSPGSASVAGDGWKSRPRRPIMSHTASIGFRSGLLPGHCTEAIPTSSRYSDTISGGSKGKERRGWAWVARESTPEPRRTTKGKKGKNQSTARYLIGQYGEGGQHGARERVYRVNAA
ncbi:hypothetical protein GEV33_004495 [Tenebrio molitor]|uniref:Uncharacterized protein n=1 Tax=Tenebrio molitor TaxID=7067 RepID=A0A8J6HN39_TENMO|nr:hypothetical protein GEV33_004495 [Tenebrio molitor]